jgi:hypothetical protein
VVAPERTVECDKIEVMRATTLRSAYEELALRHSLWATRFVLSGLKSMEVRERLYSRLVTG